MKRIDLSKDLKNQDLMIVTTLGTIYLREREGPKIMQLRVNIQSDTEELEDSLIISSIENKAGQVGIRIRGLATTARKTK